LLKILKMFACGATKLSMP